MYWKKVFGEELYNQVVQYIGNRKLSISTLVRLAVEKFIKE